MDTLLSLSLIPVSVASVTNAPDKSSKMLVDGPVEWAETSIPAGNKLNLLQHAYHSQLGVAALPRDATVVLVQYDRDGASDEVIETSKEEIVLHPSAANEKETRPDAFRFVAWSSTGSSPPVALQQSACVAIATAERVEVWRVSVHESLQAVFVGSFSKSSIRGVCWHPSTETLLVYNDAAMDLVLVTPDGHLRVQHELVPESDKARVCVWSPCGLVLARSSESRAQFYSWPTAGDLALAPSVASYRLDARSTLLEGESKLGSITATVLLSSSVCMLVTDTPLVLADIHHSNSLSEEAHSSPVLSSLTSATANASNVIDLTSLRVTAASKSSLLNILDHSKIRPHEPAKPAPKRTSHVVVVAKNPMGQWHRYAEVALDQLAIPDVAMRVVIGSTISNRIVALHLDHSLKTGWSASVSGELKLPEGHVCRGLRLVKTSPFVQVASTEKIRRTFYHATSGPQRIQLSKFKVPRRRRDADRKSSIETPPVAATNALTSTTNPDMMATLLTRIEALQMLMVARFDHVEKRLDDVVGRLARLEVQQPQQSL